MPTFLPDVDRNIVTAQTFAPTNSHFTFMRKVVLRKQADILKNLNYLSVWFHQQHGQCYSKQEFHHISSSVLSKAERQPGPQCVVCRSAPLA